ncbi:hypothetical protein AVEN_249084-1 [Araneus ventricosus]|uniref:Uncharacterized protein n=1 Tax=Araneus ventricosus TaxID=182803 RepID=A0A4Y2CN15_ARAVE|nr:hypothetical protein AVEN_249084-1 [Araneus ventricosus]
MVSCLSRQRYTAVLTSSSLWNLCPLRCSCKTRKEKQSLGEDPPIPQHCMLNTCFVVCRVNCCWSATQCTVTPISKFGLPFCHSLPILHAFHIDFHRLMMNLSR